MVVATVALISVITKTPRKLNTADMKTAALGGIARVATHVAIALGASVHPFTKMTPSVSSTVMRRTGLEMSCSINHVNSISKTRSPFRQRMPAFPLADAVRHFLISLVIFVAFLYYHRFSANSTCFFDFYESNSGILVKTEKIRNKWGAFEIKYK